MAEPWWEAPARCPLQESWGLPTTCCLFSPQSEGGERSGMVAIVPMTTCFHR